MVPLSWFPPTLTSLPGSWPRVLHPHLPGGLSRPCVCRPSAWLASPAPACRAPASSLSHIRVRALSSRKSSQGLFGLGLGPWCSQLQGRITIACVRSASSLDPLEGRSGGRKEGGEGRPLAFGKLCLLEKLECAPGEGDGESVSGQLQPEWGAWAVRRGSDWGGCQ